MTAPLERALVALESRSARTVAALIKRLDDTEEALREVELNGFEDVPTAFLSAGQTRRVALARLLVCPAPLWVLDEPFTALDRHGMELFEGMLDQHLENGGLAVLSTHRPVRLDPGRVVTLDLSAA